MRLFWKLQTDLCTDEQHMRKKPQKIIKIWGNKYRKEDSNKLI
jgi:hypothetical protein